MITKTNISLALFIVFLSFTSCRKDKSTFVSDVTAATDCDNMVMQIKKMQSTTHEDEYIDAQWNTDGTIKMIKMNLAFSENKTANYVYENGRITKAILNNNVNDPQTDTVVYHYNTTGKVDSMYLKVGKDAYNSSIKLTYTEGKLTKLTGYMDTTAYYYWDIETDEQHNITQGIEYSKSGDNFKKESTYTYTRDKKKNPFTDLAVYMLYLDDAPNIFQHWGNNNYTDQRSQSHTDVQIDLTTGAKFKYNEHCYPVSYKNTAFGMVLLNEDAFVYTYY